MVVRNFAISVFHKPPFYGTRKSAFYFGANEVKMFPKKLKIMDNDWTIKVVPPDEFEYDENVGGYCNPYLKEIAIQDVRDSKNDIQGINAMKAFLRHEICHALFAECGLWCNTLPSENWSMNEEGVDWIANNVTRLYGLYEVAKCL